MCVVVVVVVVVVFFLLSSFSGGLRLKDDINSRGRVLVVRLSKVGCDGDGCLSKIEIKEEEVGAIQSMLLTLGAVGCCCLLQLTPPLLLLRLLLL